MLIKSYERRPTYIQAVKYDGTNGDEIAHRMIITHPVARQIFEDQAEQLGITIPTRMVAMVNQW